MAQDNESHTRTVTGGGGDFAFLHHVEMRVEGRDLVDLGERKLHLGGERGEMRGREMAVAVLDEMQMLDQEIALAAARAKQRADLVERGRIDLAALGGAARAAAAVAIGASPFGCRRLPWDLKGLSCSFERFHGP